MRDERNGEYQAGLQNDKVEMNPCLFLNYVINSVRSNWSAHFWEIVLITLNERPLNV